MFLGPLVSSCSMQGATARSGQKRTWDLRRRTSRKVCVSSKFCGQATKGAWWMPWQKQAKKDVASCDKPRRAASRLIRGCPNGETLHGKTVERPTESIGGHERTQGSEP